MKERALQLAMHYILLYASSIILVNPFLPGEIKPVILAFVQEICDGG